MDLFDKQIFFHLSKGTEAKTFLNISHIIKLSKLENKTLSLE
jgi:hypothetical protein